MKKVILSLIGSGVFIIALVMSFNTSSTVTFAEEAFANGTCCYEYNSICSLDGEKFRNRYFKSDGPCNDAEPVDPVPVGDADATRN